MNLFTLLPFAAGALSLALAAVSLTRRTPSVATWLFRAGMAVLGVDSIFTGLGLRGAQLGEGLGWLAMAFVVRSFVPVLWLGFSLTYSRPNYREFLARWKIALAIFGLVPIGLSFAFRHDLFQLVPAERGGEAWRLHFGGIGRTLNVMSLVAFVLVLMNLEQTFRSAVGTMRWRIKFVVLALVVIFGARLYVRSQAILFSAPDTALWSLESSALLVGCLLLTVAYARAGWSEIDVHPSSAVLRSSLTVLVVGVYLFVVGVLAQVARRFGGSEFFQLQALVVLAGLTGLALLLSSDRARQRLHVFVARHFRKAQHDSVRIWTDFSGRLASVTDQAGLCAVSVKLIAERFDVLSVAIWLVDEDHGKLELGASTARQASAAGAMNRVDVASQAVTEGLSTKTSPFDLETAGGSWADEWRQLNPTTFARGGSRLCVPLRSADRGLGALVLADRINGAIYTVEESELLACIGAQIGSVLLTLRLASDVARAREFEAFQTMSAFFVHDLKNAASSLNLTLKNLPVHFDDPEFRQDALRGIGNTASRIDDMIARLSALRRRPEPARVDADLNQLVNEALDNVRDMPNVQLTRDLQPLPRIRADRAEIHGVVTNLVLNARDAVGADGHIRVCTELRDGRVVLSVADNGCGISETFLRESLFRPFQSTKQKGLGIGLFQARAVIQAHGGGMHVESEVGKGTTFLVTLPVSGQS